MAHVNPLKLFRPAEPMKATSNELAKLKSIEEVRQWVIKKTWNDQEKCHLLGRSSWTAPDGSYKVSSDNFRIVELVIAKEKDDYTLWGQKRENEASKFKQLDRKDLDFNSKDQTFSAVYKNVKHGKAYVLCYERDRSVWGGPVVNTSQYGSSRLACIGELGDLPDKEKAAFQMVKAGNR